MKWIFENIQIVVALVAALAYYLTRAKRRDADEAEERPFRPPTDEEREQLERTKRIQEEIRRKIAERRGAAEPIPRPLQAETEPPVIETSRVPPVDPFGGSMRRILREIGEAVESRAEPVVDTAAQARAELERQRQLAEQLRALEASRLAEERRVSGAAALVSVQRSMPTALPGIRMTLRDPRELRRAIVLREVLGLPVALR